MLEGVNATATDNATAPAVAEQAFGSGPVRIDMFLDASINANDYRDGAALAIKELGAGQLTLVTHDMRVQGTDPASKVRQASENGAKLFIAAPSLLAALSAASPKSTTILLGTDPANSTPAIQSDEIGAAIEASSYAAGAGLKKIMVVATRALNASEVQRLKDGLKQGGAQLLDIVTDPTSADGVAKLAKLEQAQAVLLIGADAPKVAAPALRQRGGLGADIPFLGTFAWSASTYNEPALEGSLLALVDQNALKRISTRFQTTYARPLSLEAAYGFDTVAVAAGIVRSKGQSGLDPASLRVPSGFTGATGLFRFKSDGRVERRLAIYRLSGGKLTLQDGAPSGF